MKKTLGLIGRKLGMTRVFADDGTVVPATVIQAGPCPVVQKKGIESDGYVALQVGFEESDANRLNKPDQGHQRKADCGFFKHLREFRLESVADYDLGQALTVDMFESGEKVAVTGTSKGR